MRVLFALPGFHRYERGAEVALLSVADALASTGTEVTVMGSGPARAQTRYDFIEVPSVRRERFERFPTIPPFRSETAWEDATFALSLMRAFRPEDYDFVVTCSFPFTHWALRRPAKRKPLQIFVTQNGDWPAFSNDGEFRTFRCDGLVCTNPDYLERNKETWNCALIPNGINLERFLPGASERERLGLPLGKPVVLMVSALIESKRVLDGIRAVAELAEAVLVVAGDGPLRDEAEALARQLLPDRFLRVSLPASDMPALYRSADVFLHMSLLESFGNVFLEAWACGLPIVAQDSERLRWILGEESPYLCDTKDRQTTGAHLQKALLSGKSSKRPESIADFSWSRIGQQYHSFFARLSTKASSGLSGPS
ncbi:MAG: glycosyltransferase family 4 protein [Erythrobacteraceae bacterium]|jgi:glycosyltransferase involved in cell wall biosynthesis